MSTSGLSKVKLEENVSFSSNQSNPIKEPSETQLNILIQAKPRRSRRITHVSKKLIGEICDLVFEH
jgi:hypothetical protein